MGDKCLRHQWEGGCKERMRAVNECWFGLEYLVQWNFFPSCVRVVRVESWGITVCRRDASS